MVELGFIGSGRVTRIILDAARLAGKNESAAIVTDPSAEALAATTARFPSIDVTASVADVAASELVFLAVPPPAIDGALREIAPALRRGTVIISLAPRVSIASMLEAVRPHGDVVRMIPNAPAALGRGFNPIAFPESMTGEVRDVVRRRLAFLGELPVVPESALEAWAVITGMGPTYVWFQMLELERLGVEFGLDANDVRRGVTRTVEGAAALLADGSRSAAEVLDLVPFHPLRSDEAVVTEAYERRLRALFAKLTPLETSTIATR